MADSNEELIQELVRDGYLKTPRIIEAFKKVDRKDFVPKKLYDEAYGNYPLPIGEGQTISQPLTVAFMLELLCPMPGEKILDVGAGSGWTTALLAYIVGKPRTGVAGEMSLRGSRTTAAIWPEGSSRAQRGIPISSISDGVLHYVQDDARLRQIASPSARNDKKSDTAGYVVAIERISELCKFGENNIRKYNFIKKGIVKYFCGDASRGLPKGFSPSSGFDKILSGAAAQEKIPDIWKRWLKIGGRIVAPVGQSVVVLDKISDKEFRAKEHSGFSFVPLISDTE